MNLQCRDIGLSIVIPDNLLEKLYHTGMRHYPKEFGGILIGHYSEDMKICYVVDTIIPKKYKSAKYSFERGKEGLEKELKTFYEGKPRLIYVGEWHTHPDMMPEPSETDKQALKEISNHNEVNIANPLLLILSNTKTGFTYSCYVQFKNKLYKYETNN